MGKFTERLRVKSNMIHMGEKVAFGSECVLMDQAADIIDELAEALAKLTDICERQPRFYKLIPAEDSPLGLARAALSKLESLSNE